MIIHSCDARSEVGLNKVLLDMPAYKVHVCLLDSLSSYVDPPPCLCRARGGSSKGHIWNAINYWQIHVSLEEMIG